MDCLRVVFSLKIQPMDHVLIVTNQRVSTPVPALNDDVDTILSLAGEDETVPASD